ncbi:MAG: hypothetical protein JNK85_25905 [Verrucomicrobiales bacterium]|nr:hypothetical protein [Verrucomicrobiales bacterium]
MKTRRHQLAGWFAAGVLGILASGCGAKTVGGADRSADLGTNQGGTTSVAAIETPGSTTNTSVATAVEAPIVRRSEKSNVTLRPEIDEVVRLVESGAGEEVTRAYVGASSVAYDLTLDEVIYLRDVGIPDSVIAAMMRRGGELRAQAADTATMQTNLVAAVNQLKDALAEGASNGATLPDGNVTDSTASSSAAGTAPPPPPNGSAEPIAVQAPAAPADAPEEVQQFYGDLSPYGTWYQMPSGWVWRPSVVVVDPYWMPYRHGGRWVWSDWGWYWCSDYSWGWAPFHYGRWTTYPGLGWCWVPDRVWGPSWVTWRHHGTYVGWAPLPPGCGWRSGFGLTWYGEGVSVSFGFGLASHCYTFVSRPNFCHRNLHHHAVREREVNTVYNNSTVINNVINGNNNTIVNNGVGYNNIAEHVRGEVPKARVEALPQHSDKPLRADRMERSKDGFVVYRPAAVEAVGGRPAALRPEVRPVNATASAAVVPGRTARPVAAGRDVSLGSAAGKGVESRGPGMVSGVDRPAAPNAAPNVTRVPTSRSSADYSTKPVESRRPQVGTAAPQSGNTPVVGEARRQTLPVPLADPSRNIPSRSVNPRTVQTSPSKPAYESRGNPNVSAPLAPSAPPVPRSVQQAPSVNVRPPANSVTPSPSLNRPNAGSTYNAPSTRSAPSMAPKVDYQRPSSYSQPAPSVASPRPSLSTPAPSVSAPRPSYSAPAPAVAAPRPSYSAPAPASAPSNPSGSAGRSGGGPRQQQN